jgi:hypothetical protein
MTTMVQFQSFYDPGTPDRKQEDGVITNAFPDFGVIDAFSEPHSPAHPPREFEYDQTQGQWLRSIIVDSIQYWSRRKASLSRTIKHINEGVLQTKYTSEITPEKEVFYSGLSFLIGKIDQNIVEIVQGGDCTAVVLLKSGDTKVIWGKKFHPVEVDLRRKIAEIMRSPEVSGDRGKMWDKFYPYLCWSRRERGNSKYPVLDGRPGLMDLVEITSIPLDQIQTIVCSTDGMVPWDENPDWQDWGRRLLLAVESEQAFKAHMEWVRTYEMARDAESHETNAEATCQAVYFDD